MCEIKNTRTPGSLMGNIKYIAHMLIEQHQACNLPTNSEHLSQSNMTPQLFKKVFKDFLMKSAVVEFWTNLYTE